MKALKNLSLLLLLVLAFTGCHNKSSKLADFNRTVYTPEYASGFDIKGADGKKSVLVTVTNPWQGADSITTNLFIARDDEEVPADFTGQMLKGDAERIVCMSSTHIAMLDAIGETAREVLPSNYTYEFGGISREESKTTNNATLIFLLCMVLVYLILCALYESVFIPFAVLLSVPCGLMGSFLFAWLFGLENNIYMQTGLIMIIGLLAKTAILLTEYAGKRRSEGMTLAQAAYSAAKVRLRPILMTVLSMVFGLVPLMMAHGVGANGSRSLATGVIGGMIVGTLALLFLVPSLFIVFQYIQERVKHN